MVMQKLPTNPEWAALALYLLGYAQHPDPSAVVIGLGGLSLYGLRRHPWFREQIGLAVEEMAEKGVASRPAAMLAQVLPLLTVPPVTQDVPMLPPPRRDTSRQEAFERTDSPLFHGLFGDEDPREVVRRPARQPRPGPSVGRSTPALGTRTRQLPAVPEPAGEVVVGWTIRHLLEYLNSESAVEDCPHVIIVAPSRTGKTTLAQLIVGTRPGKVLILDAKRPKGWEGPKWGGLPYLSADPIEDDDPPATRYTSIARGLKLAVDEMHRRYKAQETATSPFEPLTVVLDEAKVTVEECEEVAALYRKIVSMGAEAGVRLIVLTTTDRARKLGLDGEADSLDSFVHIRLGEFAQRVQPVVSDLGGDRWLWAAIRYAGSWVPFDNSKTRTLLQQVPLSLGRVWRSKAVAYNCQVPPQWSRVAVGDGPREQAPVVERPRRPARDYQMVSTASGGPGYDLLAELMRQADGGLRKNGVLNVSNCEVPMKWSGTPLRGEVLRKSQIGTSEALITTSHDVARLAAELLKTASAEEREALRKSLQSMRHGGVSKTQAIREAFGVEGGPRFQRAARLIDAARMLAVVRRAA